MRGHKDLEVWKRNIGLVKNIYKLTKPFPKEELYGLTNQIRRSAVSIPSNIAEGAARNYKKKFKQFLYVSLGSLSELETQLIIAKEIEYLEIKNYESLNTDLILIRKMLIGLIKSIN